MWSKVISQVTGPYRYFCIDTLRALDTKVRPRFDGDRVYVHDSIVLTVIGGSTHVTHSMFVTFWRDKRGFMCLHIIMSSWWDFGLKTMQTRHDLWIFVMHPDSWYLYHIEFTQCCSALQDRSQEFAWRLYQHDIKGFQVDCLETQWIQQRLKDIKKLLSRRPLRMLFTPVVRHGSASQFALHTLFFPIIEVQSCLEGCAVNSMKCS